LLVAESEARQWDAVAVESVPVTQARSRIDLMIGEIAATFGFDKIVDVLRFNGGRYAFANLMKRPVAIRLLQRVRRNMMLLSMILLDVEPHCCFCGRRVGIFDGLPLNAASLQ
jgi:hypothetical protein